MEDTTDYLSISERTSGIYLGQHIFGIGEPLFVGIEQFGHPAHTLRHIDELLIAVPLALQTPLLAALLEDPHTRNILQQSRCAVHATLVGEVKLHTSLGDNR